MKTSVRKKIPRFTSEDEERDFWAKSDSTEYVDWSRSKRVVFPNLRPSLKTISLRIPSPMLEQLKLLANRRDVPYQSLLKMFLAERIAEELRGSSKAGPQSRGRGGTTPDSGS